MNITDCSRTVRTLDRWASERAQSLPLASLKNAVIGIEAAHYLNRFLTPSQEPLLSAVGGSPLGLKTLIENELAAFRDAEITPIFVFNGLESGKKLDPFNAGIVAARTNADAFEVYHKGLGTQAVRQFGSSGARFVVIIGI